MAQISREDVLKLAKLSALALDESELPRLAKQIESVLNYARRVGEIATEHPLQVADHKAHDIYRKDEESVCDSNALLDLAPERAERFFVVPRILEGAE
mgnify:CR=1 FL=1